MTNEDKALKLIEFSVFCIENLALRLQIPPQESYDLLTKDSDLLHTFILPCYDVLHTQDKDYVIDDLINALKMKGIAVA